MCRLYGLQSSHPTRVGCELVRAQNALIRQSIRDARGFANPHGWGIGYRSERGVVCKREVDPASDSAQFRRIASDIRTTSLLAHVRRATVGRPKLVNTHPFRDGNTLLAHNGHIDHFDSVRPKMLDAMTEQARAEIDGETDSEHLLGMLTSFATRRPEASPLELLRSCIKEIEGWARSVGRRAEVSLNILWTVDDGLAGARYGRSLWYLERDRPHRCDICGRLHAEVGPDASYRAAEFASERISEESWEEVPRETVFWSPKDDPLTIEPIRP